MRVSVCVGDYAKKPYCVPGLEVNVFCLEELCCCLKPQPGRGARKPLQRQPQHLRPGSASDQGRSREFQLSALLQINLRRPLRLGRAITAICCGSPGSCGTVSRSYLITGLTVSGSTVWGATGGPRQGWRFWNRRNILFRNVLFWTRTPRKPGRRGTGCCAGPPSAAPPPPPGKTPAAPSR